MVSEDTQESLYLLLSFVVNIELLKKIRSKKEITHRRGKRTMTRLILIRHGESLANQMGVFAGHTDFELSELGMKQAEKTA